MTLTALLVTVIVAFIAAATARSFIFKRWGMQTQPGKGMHAVNQHDSQIINAVKRLGDISPVQSSHAEDYRTKLAQAGIRLDLGTWRGMQVLSGIAGLLIALSLILQSPDTAHLFFTFIVASLGLFGPRLVVASLTRDRHRQIETSLASTLELLSLAVKSGYPLERAIKLVGQNTKGPLSEEFRQIDTDINLLGMDLEHSLERLRKRCDIPGLSTFAVSLIQAHRQGSSVTRVLESQAREARNNHYAAQLEQINKLPAKLVAPIFGIMMLIIVIALVPPIYDTVVLFSSSYSGGGDIGAISASSL